MAASSRGATTHFARARPPQPPRSATAASSPGCTSTRPTSTASSSAASSRPRASTSCRAAAEPWRARATPPLACVPPLNLRRPGKPQSPADHAPLLRFPPPPWTLPGRAAGPPHWPRPAAAAFNMPPARAPVRASRASTWTAGSRQLGPGARRRAARRGWDARAARSPQAPMEGCPRPIGPGSAGKGCLVGGECGRV
jgi:hypothetical protein